jgi:hypothetical protein
VKGQDIAADQNFICHPAKLTKNPWQRTPISAPSPVPSACLAI